MEQASKAIGGGGNPTVGEYEVLKRIGKGGMASVYLARVRGEAGFIRVYALKVLHPHLAEDRASVDMLMDEAKLAARLNHPNIASTVDLGYSDGRYYVAMEYVEGIALDRMLRKHPDSRPVELIVPIAIQALEGLAAAHELCDDAGAPLGVVHRDVTPGNVLIGVDGRALIADFGVAKARARLTKTMPGIVKGKAGYIAPEVVLGRDVDWRADVFSMGVLLWNALTGETLFDTDDLAKSIRALVSLEVPPPSTVGLMPPALFDQPILTALAKDPDERHASARDMVDALSDALALHAADTPQSAIGEWVEATFGAVLEERRRLTAPETETSEIRSREAPTRRFKTSSSSEISAPAAEEDDEGAATIVSEAPSELAEQAHAAFASALPPPAQSPTGFAEPAPASVPPAPLLAAEADLDDGTRASPLRSAILGLLVGVILLGLGVLGWMAYTHLSAPTEASTSALEAVTADSDPEAEPAAAEEPATPPPPEVNEAAPEAAEAVDVATPPATEAAPPPRPAATQVTEARAATTERAGAEPSPQSVTASPPAGEEPAEAEAPAEEALAAEDAVDPDARE